MKLDLNDLKTQLAGNPLVASLKKRLLTRSALAITLESGRMAVSLVRGDTDEAGVVQSFSLPLGDDDVLKDPDKAGQELAAALKNAGIRERRSIVCVPAGWALTASSDLPEVGAEDLRGYLELRAEREFTLPAGELRLGYCAYALPNGQRRATLAALPSKKLEAIDQMLKVANRRAASVSLALEHCLSQPQAMLHFLTNGNHTDVVITAGGGVAGLRSLPGPQVTGDTPFDPVAFCRDVRITLGRLPEPVRQQVRRAEFGGPSAQQLCAETRQSLIQMGIETPDCSATRAGVTPETPGAAVESARLQLKSLPVAFEFVVPETNRWQELFQRVDSSRRKQVIIAFAALVLLPLLILFIRSEMESHYQSQWNAIAADADELDRLQKKIHEFRPWYEPAPQGVSIFESLAAAFPESGDVWAKSVHLGTDGMVTCTGYARSQYTLMSLMDRMRARPDITGLHLQQTHGENPVQFSIIYQWEEQH